ncbi:MAG TPA: peptidoglycan editing factor PgeF [Actinomycetes bacterium]
MNQGSAPFWPPVLVAEELLADGVVAAFPSRAGGLSRPPYDTCNLGLRVGDEPRAVLANRRRVATVLGLAGLPWATVRQVHGSTVAPVELAALPPGPPEAKPVVAEADALVTADEGVVLAVLVADCVPVLLADPERRVVAAAHAGWRGLAAGVVEATAAAFTAAGGRPEASAALVGPAAGPCCYEVGEDVQARVAGRYPEAAATTRGGRPALDLAAAARTALTQAGFERPLLAGECTVHQPERHFSYRRDGGMGRQAGIVALVPGRVKR